MPQFPNLPELPRDRFPLQDPATRYRVCDVCGEKYDTTDLDQVFYHGPDPHDVKIG